MAEVLGHVPVEGGASAVIRREIVLFNPARDNVGTPDYAALAAEAKKTKLKKEFAEYCDAGGGFSLDLYQTLMGAVLADLQKPDVRRNSTFPTATDWQIKGFEALHNISFTREQKVAYRVFREDLVIPYDDRQKPAYLSDAKLFEDIQRMPLLKPQVEQPEQGEFQPLAKAA